MTGYYRSDPMVLRDGADPDQVPRLARELDAELVEEQTYPIDHGVVREQTWQLAPGVLLQLADDARSGSSAVTVLSEDEARVGKYTDLIRRYLKPSTAEDLLAAPKAAQDEHRQARAVMRVGFGAPYGYDERFFRLIRDAMADPSLPVRTAAVLATTYSFYPEYQDVLRAVAERELDPIVREQAADLAEAHIMDDEGTQS